jgi:hypothetical protein
MVCEPLQLTICCRIEMESQMELGFTLQGQPKLLQSRGFILIVVHTDPQSVFKSLTAVFPSTVIDEEGACNSVGKVDAETQICHENYHQA